MKTCFVSVVSDHYIDSFLTLLYSVKKHNPDIDLEWRVFTNKEWCPLNEENRKSITALWPSSTFVDVDIDPYRNIKSDRAIACFNRQSKDRKNDGGDARTWFMKFGILKFKDVDKVVYLDSDILCVRDISNLINKDCVFGAVIRKKHGGRYLVKRPHHHFNAGMMIISKTFMTDRFHNRAIKYANRNNRNGDQEVWWVLSNNHKIFAFKKSNNCNPRKLKDGVRLIHFWGAKPLERRVLRKADKLWIKYYEEMKNAL